MNATSRSMQCFEAPTACDHVPNGCIQWLFRGACKNTQARFGLTIHPDNAHKQYSPRVQAPSWGKRLGWWTYRVHYATSGAGAASDSNAVPHKTLPALRCAQIAG